MEYEKPITIKELIAKLNEYPEDMAVLVDGYEGGLDYLDIRKGNAFYEPTPFCGTFNSPYACDKDKFTFEALVLGR